LLTLLTFLVVLFGVRDKTLKVPMSLIFLCTVIFLISFFIKKNNILSLLLTLECLILIGFCLLCMSGSLLFSVIMLGIGACEAAVGLGVLVGLIRSTGHNQISLHE